MTELKTIKARVELLLREEPATRNNDNYLAFLYIYSFCSDKGLIIDPLFTTREQLLEYAKDCPPLDSFKRIRAHFQNDKGMYLADSEIKEARELKEKDYLEDLRNG